MQKKSEIPYDGYAPAERERLLGEDATGAPKYFTHDGTRVSKYLYALGRVIQAMQKMFDSQEANTPIVINTKPYPFKYSDPAEDAPIDQPAEPPIPMSDPDPDFYVINGKIYIPDKEDQRKDPLTDLTNSY